MFRGVYDFADPDSSVFVTSTGQSGHPLSRHYDDLGELWRRGEYIPMSLDRDLARAAAVGAEWAAAFDAGQRVLAKATAEFGTDRDALQAAIDGR